MGRSRALATIESHSHAPASICDPRARRVESVFQQAKSQTSDSATSFAEAFVSSLTAPPLRRSAAKVSLRGVTHIDIIVIEGWALCRGQSAIASAAPSKQLDDRRRWPSAKKTCLMAVEDRGRLCSMRSSTTWFVETPGNPAHLIEPRDDDD